MKCIVVMTVLVVATTALPSWQYTAKSLKEEHRSEALVNFVKKLDRSKRQIFGFNNGPGYDDYPTFGSPIGHHHHHHGLGNPYHGGLGFDTGSAHSEAHSYNLGVNLPFGSFGISAGDAHAYSDQFGIHGKK